MPLARKQFDVGTRVNRLVVIGPGGTNKHGQPMTRARCDCGMEKEIPTSELRRGLTKSCGCRKREHAGSLNLKHGEARTDGSATTPEYRAWRSMLSRCYSSTWRDFSNYGGRGITVCERWRESFDAFFADIGRRPSSHHSLDRINVNGNYEPGNVRWATPDQQVNNKRTSSYVTARGLTMTIAQWSREVGLSQRAISGRLKAGWSADDAVSKPLRITRLTRRTQLQQRAQ